MAHLKKEGKERRYVYGIVWKPMVFTILEPMVSPLAPDYFRLCITKM